eukprot:5758398-Alexandrium_andersonii.AAC.1
MAASDTVLGSSTSVAASDSTISMAAMGSSHRCSHRSTVHSEHACSSGACERDTGHPQRQYEQMGQ